ATAETLQFSFSSSSGNGLAASPPADFICGSPRIFWAINQKPWPGSAGDRLPPPLATLARGRSYVFELVNATPHTHPIRLHGHSFLVIESNKRKVVPYFSDTVLIHTKE